MIPTKTPEDVKHFKNLLQYFRRLTDDGITSLIEPSLLTMLENSLPFFSHLVLEDIFDYVERLTINRNVVGSNTRIRNISQLSFPPAEKVTKYGRCNRPNQSVLYGGFNRMTVLSELRPGIGDIITVSKWRVKHDMPLKYVPIFKNQPRPRSRLTGHVPTIEELINHPDNLLNERTWKINKLYEEQLVNVEPFLKEQIDDLVQFIADAFTRPVPSNHLDYLISAFFSDVILNRFENGSIDAIFYPSVKQNLSFENIAIKPSSFVNKYEIYEVKDSVVVQTSPGTFMLGLGDCKSFDLASGATKYRGTGIS
jgi:hypothetical protein